MSGAKPRDYTKAETREIVGNARDVFGLDDMAKRFAKDSIVMDATARLIAQVLTEVHETQIKPLRRRVAELEAALEQIAAIADRLNIDDGIEDLARKALGSK